jgi:hypothetical protein
LFEQKKNSKNDTPFDRKKVGNTVCITGVGILWEKEESKREISINLCLQAMGNYSLENHQVFSHETEIKKYKVGRTLFYQLSSHSVLLSPNIFLPLPYCEKFLMFLFQECTTM